MRSPKNKNIAIFCSGNGSNFQAIIDAVEKKKLPVCIAVMVCDNPKAKAIQRAAKHQIPVLVLSPKLFADRKSYEKVVVSVLKSQQVQVVVLAGFMRILTPYFVNAYRGKILNIHPSYLPTFKGAHAIKDAFDAKVKQTGVTVHVVTPKLDSGPILLQQKVKILAQDTLELLEKRIHAIEHKLYPAAIKKFIQKN